MKKKLKKIPEFKNENEEFEFWSTHDTTDYIDWSQSKRAKFPNLKLSTKTISLRLTSSMLDDIKIMANKRDVPVPYENHVSRCDSAGS
jgi:predicted DNA binding CopG/RHH family protein